jgi:phosphoribosylglycinamide formyltransferase 1
LSRVAVLVSGRGSNLSALIAAKKRAGLETVEIACVISNVEGVGALDVAARAGIASHLLPHRSFATRQAFDTALVELLQKERIEHVVLAGFMRLLTSTVLRPYQHRIINVHPSLLPAFPGAHAVRDALAYGAKVTGATVHFVDEGTDTGPIISQRAIVIEDGEDEARLHARIQDIEHTLVPEALSLLSEGRLRVEGRRVKIERANR